MAEPRTVLLGDSHLARLDRALRDWPGVLNAAVGGATSLHLAAQATSVGLLPTDTVVVSVGTNDAAPWKRVPLASYVRALSDLVASWPVGRWVHVAPPGVVESRLTGTGDRTDAVVDDYRAAAIEVFELAGARVVRADLLLAPLGASAFAGDGIHLSGRGYAVLVPALREACSG